MWNQFDFQFTDLLRLPAAPWWPAVGGHAGLVRGGVPSQREERGHHVGAVRHGDPKRNRNQQPFAPPQAAPGHPGNHVPHQPVSPAHLQNGTALFILTHTHTLLSHTLYPLSAPFTHSWHFLQHVFNALTFLTRTNESLLSFSNNQFSPVCFVFLLPALFLSFITVSVLHSSGWGVSHGQSTGNVWVTHEEMESLAATPPTVSPPG